MPAMGTREGSTTMPKELVRSKYPEDHPGLVAQVGWGRDSQHVQLATVNDDAAKLEPTPEGNGWFVQLDRHGINDLIRILRRARDQAFGRDE